MIYVYSAEWCGPCKALKSALEKDGLLNKVTIIDIDDPRNGKPITNITAVPTTIQLDKHGTIKEKIVGANLSKIKILIENDI